MIRIAGTAVGPKSKRSLLPLLMVLFVIAWGLLVMLVVLQDRTIDAQRELIPNDVRSALQRNSAKAVVHAEMIPPSTPSSSQIPSAQVPTTQVPSTQIPSNQIPSTQLPLSQSTLLETPSTQVKPQASSKANRNSRKAKKPLPAIPPLEITDPSDMRRVSVSI